MSDNFIKYVHENPDPVFTQKDIDFMEVLDGSFTEADRIRIRCLEEGYYNKTTKTSSFDVIPGIRNVSRERSVYFSRFAKKTYNAILKDFSSQYIARLGEDNKYKVITSPYRIITPDQMVFYPLSYWGDFDLQLHAFSEAANYLGSRLGRFERERFVVLEDKKAFNFCDLVIEATRGSKTLPKGW